MARPKSPCGTYPAYQRHLREETPVDEACRRAQQEHDAGRGRVLRGPRGASGIPMAVPQRVSTVDDLQRRREDARTRFVEKSRAVTAVAAGDLDEVNLYEVIDLSAELDGVLDEWCGIEDEFDKQTAVVA